MDLSRAHAQALDREDPLRGLRERFYVPPGRRREHAVYLCGNSLGLQPREAAKLVNEELAAWAQRGVLAHHEGERPWVSYHEQLSRNTAHVVGALAHEVVNMNSLTVNLHLMLVSFYRPTRERAAILIERGAFPSDRYAIVSQLAFRGLDPATHLIEVGPREGEDDLRTDDLLALIGREGDRIALVMMPGVQYRTGQALDMEAIAQAALRKGCRVGFDLAHAAGNVELRMHGWGADFAVWCNYKYLNGGPGAVAGCFVHERHAHDRGIPRFAGWWGHDKASRFLMGPEFEVLEGAEGWQISNPPILAMAPLIASLQLFREAEMPRLRAKSLRLTGYLESLLLARFGERVRIVTPRDPQQRGCQLSLRVPGGMHSGKRVHDALLEQDAVVDWREPDVIRVAPVPLYNTFEDVWEFVELLEGILRGQ